MDPLSSSYWTPEWTAVTKAAGTALNTHGAINYRTMRLLRHHPWQAWPGGDLANEIESSSVAEQLPATSA